MVNIMFNIILYEYSSYKNYKSLKAFIYIRLREIFTNNTVFTYIENRLFFIIKKKRSES